MITASLTPAGSAAVVSADEAIYSGSDTNVQNPASGSTDGTETVQEEQSLPASPDEESLSGVQNTAAAALTNAGGETEETSENKEEENPAQQPAANVTAGPLPYGSR